MAFRFGLIGSGMVAGVFHRAAAQDPQLEIAGVYARSSEARVRVADSYDTPIFETLPDLIAAEIDAVIVATPPDARAEIIAACAAAKMPVLSEKPLERTTQAAEALVAAMHETPFGVTLQHRMRPASQAAKELMDLGEIGTPRMLKVDVPWWREASYYATPGRGTYARDGGGVLLTQAIHALDLGLWLMGTPVTRVQGQTFRAFHTLEAEDTAVAGLTFANGAAGMVTATTAAFPGHPETIELICEHATLRLVSGRLDILHHDGTTQSLGAEGGTGSGADPMAFPHDWHLAVMADFAGAVSQGHACAIPAASALPVHRVIDAITTSAQTGRAVNLVPGSG